LGQTVHRINLIKSWGIQPGENVLELGCGQGDCTAALAFAVGESGKVVAVDPGSLDYGSPWTLGEAQSHLLSSQVGSRMSFVQADPVAFLKSFSDPTPFSSAVLAHCTYYFQSPGTLLSTFLALKPHCKRICIAEHALSSSKPQGYPHILTAIAEALLEAFKPEGHSDANIRTLFTPTQIKAIAEQAGLRLVKEDIIEAPANMYDGSWEVGNVLHNDFDKQVETWVKGDRHQAVIKGLKDAVIASKANVGKVATMDAWVGVFEV